MKKTIKKLDNGDFLVEPDNVTLYGIGKMHTSKDHMPAAKDVHWNKPIKRNRKEQLTLEEIHYRHQKNRMDQMEGWPKPDHKHYTPVSNVAKALINEVPEEDPNITLLNEIIEGAHKRIAMYEMLQNGMWYATFRCDSTDEILRERELIEEFKRMKQEILEWKERL